MAQTKPTTTPSQDIAELSKQIDALKEDISGLSSAFASLASSSRDAAITGAREKAAQARAAGEDQVDAMLRNAEELGQRTSTAIREQPAMAVGLAVGAGFLLGLLLGRR
ncbi:hypothetical protein AB0T83_10435 [Fluviibacterium sp. DFM31]|uniref:DUF883 domain-containing protein n=1 Tax=Meridianimarinicoccus marinus TaxID=3231483 RepID=A0ABV3L6J0_9RHOB